MILATVLLAESTVSYAQDAEPTSEDAKPPPAPKTEPPALKVGMGVRTGLAMAIPDEGDTTLSLDDGLLDQILIRPYFSGQLNDYMGVVANFELGTPTGRGTFHILDAIFQLKLAEEFQIWIGQHISANDRNNMNGPFFHNSWNFPVDVESYPFDTGARDRGVTFWGLLAGGILKYHASIVDMQPGQKIDNLRYAGRLTLHLLEPEKFYYNSGTNFGASDMLAFGAVVQYQKGVDVEPMGDDMEPTGDDNDFLGFSFDGIFEKNFGPGGTITIEGGYWNFENVGVDYVANQGTIDKGTGIVGGLAGVKGSSYMGSISWLTPKKIGLGYLQPNARIQVGDYDANDGQVVTVDVGLAYVVDGFNNRWHLNYRHREVPAAVDGSTGTATEDIIQIGTQMQL